MKLEFIKPNEIEKRSFQIIDEEIKISVPKELKPIVYRAIHTTADFSYAETLYFSENVIEKAKEALMKNATIITDTNMALSGINKTALKKLECHAECFMADQNIAKEAKKRDVTRATVSMEKASKLNGPIILVVGNAPTALVKIREMYDKENFKPSLVIGVPVGFVNVVASKEMIIDTKIPCIINRGRKGGSNVAASIVNALMYSLVER